MAEQIVYQLEDVTLSERVDLINAVRETLHKASPFKSEPVDFVRWVKNEDVTANDYNPNSVAPPEMELLRTSISADGYTQPIVGNEEDGVVVVVDGFHRHRVGKECADIQSRIHGYLPVVQIRAEQVGREERMASTVRHNRARGKHKVEAMSDMVIELKRRNWSDAKICKELGMDRDEVLRLCQISGLMEVFADQEFSQAWEAEGSITPDDFSDLSGNVEDYEDEEVQVKTANTDDENRIFHTFDKWECHAAGFYESKPPRGLTADQCRAMYRDFLADLDAFSQGLETVITTWVHSCEHYLTNAAMNRIAWLGQAAMCAAQGIPAEFRGGYTLLTEDQQEAADKLALVYLNKWLVNNGRPEVSMEEANPGRQAEIY
jgi:ParB-like chromosome segregation protein Spo0J